MVAEELSVKASNTATDDDVHRAVVEACKVFKIQTAEMLSPFPPEKIPVKVVLENAEVASKKPEADSKTLEGGVAPKSEAKASSLFDFRAAVSTLVSWVLNAHAYGGVPYEVVRAAKNLDEAAYPESVRFQGLTIDQWVGIARRLWDLIDDIDTAGDKIKPSNSKYGSWQEYFESVRRLCKERHAELKTDGYVLVPFNSESLVARTTSAVKSQRMSEEQKPRYEPNPPQSVAVHSMLDLPARREKIEILLKRYKRTALDEACEPETLDHALTEALAQTVLQLIDMFQKDIINV